MTSKSPCATETGRKIVEHHDTLAGIEERVNHVASDYPAPPVTRTVMLGGPLILRNCSGVRPSQYGAE
jgi:hypothetical protein